MQNQAVDVKDLFEDLKTDWKSRTRYMSNSAQMAAVKSYQRIIGLGPAALPLILQELNRETDHWFWALKSITGEDPVDPADRGRLRRMADTWLQWADDPVTRPARRSPPT